MWRLRDRARELARPTGPRPRPDRRAWLFDAALALVLTGVGVQYAREHAGDAWPGPVAVAVVAGVALAWRRRYPLAVLWIVTGAMLLAPAEAVRPEFYACVVAAYSAAAFSPYRVPALAGLAVAALAAMAAPDSSLPTVPNEYVPFAILVPVVLAANGRRAWQRRAAEQRERFAAAARAAEAEERARIARELHDVVTHHVSMMIIQAGAARHTLAGAPDQAIGALLAVEASGRAAMTDLRQVMGLLATEPSPAPADGADPGPGLCRPAALEPLPGLDRLEALVSGVRGSGVAVALAVHGTPRPLPDGVDLAAYRVVQEALTNTVKHAAGAGARVDVHYGADELRVEVTDTGSARSGPGGAGGPGSGRGLIGLRERVAVLAGTLRAGPEHEGFAVRAAFPLERV
ncbi:sensor histidine kinase [Dactylosporangium sp. NPDC051541]|uniref:sensor histidine kinase n=1 Tax=Dactylosporangium sp. NPDC051541 TaxID=3363977 RepID=UPI0037B20904